MYKTEAQMIKDSKEDLAKSLLESTPYNLHEEVPGLFGIPDVVLVADKIISVEYKLSNWKRALQQAFKYLSFSNESYVILDEPFVKRAQKNIDMFHRSNIGLGYVDNDGKIIFCHKPQTQEPYSPAMYEKVLLYNKRTSA